MSKVVNLFQKNAADDPDHVLEQAKGQFKQVVVLGLDFDDRFNAMSDNVMTIAECNWLADMLKKRLLESDDE
jgi:hypothetical protein